jgi:soluble lytic murein transglycosylase
MVRASSFVLILAVAVAGLAGPVGAQTKGARARAAPVSLDERFLAAREAFRQGQYARLVENARELRGHVLEPYVEYYQLRMRLEELPVEPVREFLARQSGTYIADLLRRDWLRTLGRRGEWTLFEAGEPGLVADDRDIACYALEARRRRGDREVLAEFRAHWAAPRDLPEGCAAIATAAIASGSLGGRQVWERARMLLEAGQLTAAKRTLALLPADEAPAARTIDAIQAKPNGFVESADKLDLGKRANRELLLFAFARAARSDPEQAIGYWQGKLRARLPAEDQAWVWAQIATAAAKRHDPRAPGWFALAEGAPLTDEQREWRVRAALRAEEWGSVRAAIRDMPAAQRDDPAWRYWEGRALRALGQKGAGDAAFERIAGAPHFYGKLALEELDLPLAVPPRAGDPTAEELAAAAANVGLQRSLALFRLGLRTEAVYEWNWALRGMDDRQLLAAAEFARRNELWDRAINTANRTVELHDFNIRFLAPYRSVFAERAGAHGLEDAWVLGLVRQESRFIVNARSVAGASGLMQLMPATARWIAKQSGMHDFSPARVTDIEVNVALGTSYLKYVLDELDGSPVLASAGYNAGPGRARRWKADRPLEGAIYAETIPFNETRDYVKQVMSNTMYYAALYGRDQRPLKQRLGVIPPRRAGEGYAATITGQATLQ